jgi:glycosyltransferase involved in cell wall biosynthesis
VSDISVVIPTHDRTILLEHTLRSVLGQVGVDLEVVVVDDGSAADVEQMLRPLKDRRVRVVRNEVAQGVSEARNRGIEETSGNWVAFVDDDDLWAPDKLHHQIHALHETGRLWAYAGSVKIDLRGAIVGGRPPHDPELVARHIKRWNLVSGGCSSVIVDRSTLRSAGGFDQGLVNLADWDLWIRVAEHGPPASVPSPVVAYRVHPGNSSSDLSLIRAEMTQMEGRYGEKVDWGAFHHYLAWVALRSGNRSAGVANLLRAAAHGEGVSVMRDVVAVLRAKSERRFPRWISPSARERADRSWRASAESWLGSLA